MKRQARSIVVGLCMVLATACESTRPKPRSHPLLGTAWELVSIGSTDDAQGRIPIALPARFTLRFGPDRRVMLRLDCNRGVGSWRARAAAADSGTLNFGLIAITRARCEPPHLDERVARDLAQVRSYQLKEGRLYLSLIADGGIYEWRPAKDK